MESFIITTLVGILLVVIGVINLQGNISLLHSYHRKRVAPEDVKPLGKRVGAGMLICGGASFFYGLFSLIHEFAKHPVFLGIGAAILFVGIAVGLFIQLKAIIKYNKGLF